MVILSLDIFQTVPSQTGVEGLLEECLYPFPIHLSPYPEFPSFSHEVSQEQRAGAAIGGAVICGTVLLAAATLLAVFFHRQRHTFKGDYSTKKQDLGNGFSKAGSLPPCPSLPQILTYPEDSHNEKKSEMYGGEGVQEFHGYSDNGMTAYSTLEDSKRCRYVEQSYIYDYGSEVEISVDMVSQMDGSVISKEEWYV